MTEPGWPARDATTQVHVGARVGRHVSRSREETLGQLIGESSPLFNRVLPLYFFHVGLCSHTVLHVQDAWRHGGRRIEAETLDRVDRSPRDQQLTHLLKICISDGSPNDTWMHHTRSIVVAISSCFIGRS